VHRSVPEGGPDAAPSSSVIERAIAKSAKLVPAASDGPCESARPDPAPAVPQEPTVRWLEIDSAVLARAGIFTP
jgi:hypothetical protein